CRSASEICNDRWAEGRATITTDASSTIISWAIAITASDHQRRGSGSCRVASTRFLGAISFVVTVCLISELQSERLLRFADDTERSFRLSNHFAGGTPDA